MSNKVNLAYIQQTDEERGMFDDVEMRFLKAKKLKLALVCVPNYGHMNPMSQLAKACADRGHEVHVMTIDNETRPKIEKLYEDKPEVKLIFTQGPAQSICQMTMSTNDKGETGDQAFLNAWQPFLIDAVKALGPDMVVCDLWTSVGIVAADEIGIPCIVQNVFPWQFCEQFGLYEAPSFKNASNCCGCICMFRGIMAAGQRETLWYAMKQNPKAAAAFLAHNRRVIINTTFWGLEDGTALPPNVIVTGPLYDPPSTTDLIPALKAKDDKLYDWLEQARKDKVDVVYVSIGTEAIWRQWSVDVIFKGLKKLGVKVVWSLKDFQIPEPENPNFYVRPWIPQIEVLAHSSVKAGLTHCGMGGTLEFINAGVPLVAWPHFGDQHCAAELLEKNGVAKIIANQMRMSAELEKCLSYYDPVFDENKVHDLFKEVINDQKYRKAMIRLSAQRRTAGGKNLAVDTIERVYISGVDHLIDKGQVEKTRNWGWCASRCSICWFTLIFIALIYFTVQYFILRNDLVALSKVKV